MCVAWAQHSHRLPPHGSDTSSRSRLCFRRCVPHVPISRTNSFGERFLCGLVQPPRASTMVEGDCTRNPQQKQRLTLLQVRAQSTQAHAEVPSDGLCVTSSCESRSLSQRCISMCVAWLQRRHGVQQPLANRSRESGLEISAGGTTLRDQLYYRCVFIPVWCNQNVLQQS